MTLQTLDSETRPVHSIPPPPVLSGIWVTGERMGGQGFTGESGLLLGLREQAQHPQNVLLWWLVKVMSHFLLCSVSCSPSRKLVKGAGYVADPCLTGGQAGETRSSCPSSPDRQGQEGGHHLLQCHPALHPKLPHPTCPSCSRRDQEASRIFVHCVACGKQISLFPPDTRIDNASGTCEQ